MNLVEPYNGAAATGKAGVLDSDVEFQPVNLPPKDAEMLLSRQFNVEEICRGSASRLFWSAMRPRASPRGALASKR